MVMSYWETSPLLNLPVEELHHLERRILEHGVDWLEEDNSGIGLLHVAARRGRALLVQALLNLGANPTRPSRNGNKTPLHYAAESGDDDVVQALLHSGATADVNKEDADGNTPLHYAALSGSTVVIEALLQSQNEEAAISALVNARNRLQRTPLHFSARKGHLEVVEKFLNIGAHMNAADASGVLPFHLAARSGRTQILEQLLIADVNTTTKHGRSALHFAAAHGREAAIEWLLINGAIVEEGDEEGNTPLHWAVVKGQIDVVKHLATAGAPLCSKNKEGEMPWTCSQDEDVIRALLSCFGNASAAINVDVNAQDSYGRTLLHYAAEHGNCQAIEWLLNQGADSRHADDSGDTPLHHAAKGGKKEAAETLLKMGRQAKVNAANKGGRTPLSYALLQNHQKLVEFFVDEQCAQISVQPIVEALYMEIDLSSVVHIPEAWAIYQLPTYMALHTEKEVVFEFLLKRTKLDVNYPDPRYKRSCLHWAVVFGKKDAVSKLLSRPELRPNAEDVFGKTALQYAFERQQTEIQQELLKRGDVKAFEDTLYRDRQVYVDAANAILVGAALIASVTYAGWLQPPLNYTAYNHPTSDPVPPSAATAGGTLGAYAAVQQHESVRVFWACNSLSFFFAITTVLAGIGAVLPMPGRYIAMAVKDVRKALVVAAVFMVLSVVCVLFAFGAAGFASLPPIFKYQANMLGTVVVGGIMCSLFTAWFFLRLYRCLPLLSSYGNMSTLPGNPLNLRYNMNWDEILKSNTRLKRQELSHAWKASIMRFKDEDLPAFMTESR